jgi:catechol 2,3-dioxygenase-like lactoylglutathione lyase family enzyme
MKLVLVSLEAAEVGQTAHFYRDVIGLEIAGHHGHMPDFDLNGTYLMIIQGGPVSKLARVSAQFPVLALKVVDLDKAIDRLRRHHVELPWGIEQGETSRWVKFYDPAGNLIELVEFGQTHDIDQKYPTP